MPSGISAASAATSATQAAIAVDLISAIRRTRARSTIRPYLAACDAVARGLVKPQLRAGRPGRRVLLEPRRVPRGVLRRHARRRGPGDDGHPVAQGHHRLDHRGLGIQAGLLRSQPEAIYLPADAPAVLVDAEGEVGLAAFKDPGPFQPFVPDYDSVAFQPYTSGSTRTPGRAAIAPAHWLGGPDQPLPRIRDFSPADRMVVARAALSQARHEFDQVRAVRQRHRRADAQG